MQNRVRTVLLVLPLLLVVCDVTFAKEGVLRAGIVGCDTSHVPAFTDFINKPDGSGSVADVEVVAAFPGGSPDIPASRDRLPGFVKQLRAKNVEIVDSL